jgi:hypothetical protein
MNAMKAVQDAIKKLRVVRSTVLYVMTMLCWRGNAMRKIMIMCVKKNHAKVLEQAMKSLVLVVNHEASLRDGDDGVFEARQVADGAVGPHLNPSRCPRPCLNED